MLADKIKKLDKMARVEYVELNTQFAKTIFDGRQSIPGKPEIHGVNAFNEKMKYLRSVAQQGCPFADIAIAKIDNRIDELKNDLSNEVDFLGDEDYGQFRDNDKLSLISEKVPVDVSDYEETALKIVNALVLYDELTLLKIMDDFKKTGKLSKFQKPMMRVRRRINGCKALAFQYKDYGYRGIVGAEEQQQSTYQKMMAIYGKPTHKKSWQTMKLNDIKQLLPGSFTGRVFLAFLIVLFIFFAYRIMVA